MTFPSASVPAPAVIDGVDVDAVAAAVLGCVGVAGLDNGQFGEVASYLPGRQIPGVMVRDGRVMVQVRSRWGVPAPELAALIRAVLLPLTGPRPVDIVVADIDDPAAPLGAWPPAATPGAPGPGTAWPA